MALRSVLASLAVLATAGCNFNFQIAGPARIGSGVVAKATREPGTFRRIQVGGAAQLVVTVEDKSSAEFEIDDNLLDIVVFETDGETLTIHTTENYNSKHGLKVRLSTPELTGLDLSGAATAQIDGVAAEEFDLDLSGASSATVRGSATAFSASASGASKIRCYELETKETSASLSGASSAELHATESVAVKASGASSAKYKGNPEQVSRSISGASSIQPAESD